MCVYIYIYICICVYVCMCVYIYIYTCIIIIITIIIITHVAPGERADGARTTCTGDPTPRNDIQYDSYI